ncbi:MAG: hypothetical protein Q9M94_06880, partial [Candidatus Gracilibacteria bacterium]|nr:hypothetical protein [Candidatus Gracilibacteria bacterium]
MRYFIAGNVKKIPTFDKLGFFWLIVTNNQTKDYEYLAKFKATNTNTNTNTNLGTLIGEYPKQKWATKIIDRNNNGKDDLVAEINPWNIKSADGYAKMYYNKETKVISYKQDLSNIKQIDANGYVLAYPEIFVGNKPWNGNYVNDGSNLPVKTDNIKSLIVNAKWDYTHDKNLSSNFAMEGWFTKKEFEKTSVGNGETEMMIMWYKNIQGAAGKKIWTANIPVKVNGINKNIKFDIFKAKIGWNFITFIPQNYKDFKNVEVTFDVVDFINVVKKLNPGISDLYLENWEFGTEYGSPTIKKAKLSWNIYKYDVKAILKNTAVSKKNIDNNNKLDKKLDIFFSKMKQKYTKDEYRKKLILLIGKIDKI